MRVYTTWRTGFLVPPSSTGVLISLHRRYCHKCAELYNKAVNEGWASHYIITRPVAVKVLPEYTHDSFSTNERCDKPLGFNRQKKNEHIKVEVLRADCRR